MEYTERAAEEKKTDRRVIKTKRAIRNAFAELLSHKDINDITIKDIADTADIREPFSASYIAASNASSSSSKSGRA